MYSSFISNAFTNKKNPNENNDNTIEKDNQNSQNSIAVMTEKNITGKDVGIKDKRSYFWDREEKEDKACERKSITTFNINLQRKWIVSAIFVNTIIMILLFIR